MRGYYDDTFTIMLRDILLVIAGILAVGLIMLGIAYAFSWWMDRYPPQPRPERYPVGWWLPQDESVRMVDEVTSPYDQDEHPFDWNEWEMKFNNDGRVI